jgi:hypothetical protein
MTKLQGEITIERILTLENRTYGVTGTVEYEWEMDEGHYSDSPPDDSEINWKLLEITGFPIDDEGKEGSEVKNERLLAKLKDLLDEQITTDCFPSPW